MDRNKYEDKIMKLAMETFAEKGLEFFNIPGKVKSIGFTELPTLEINDMIMDFTFLMEDDTYIHLEFQTTDKGKDDLRRFKYYETALEWKTKKEVKTYVIYTNGISNPRTSYNSGFNSFQVKAITMINLDGDKILEDLITKTKSKITLSDLDLLNLIFVPVMGGNHPVSSKIITAFKILQSQNIDKENITAMLFAFANKFLNEKDLNKIREMIRMTKLGKMIYEDGKLKGVMLVALNLLKENVDINIIHKSTGLSKEQIIKLKEQLDEDTLPSLDEFK